MNLRAIFNVVGVLLMLQAGILTAPLLVSLFYQEAPLPNEISPTLAFLMTLGLSGSLGFLLWKWLPSGIETLHDREGFVIVGVSWVAITFIGALPFYFTGVTPQFVDAYFESMSGFTTTGASIFTNIDALPKGILFWRNMMQWLGGMGIIMLSLAIFPALGIGSFHLFKAEIPGGATVERMQPRLVETAKLLWTTYVILTVLQILFLTLGGMNLFDAVCHSFSTVATGGFSPHQDSIAYFNNLYFECVIIVFMFLGGMNFALHYHVTRGNFSEALRNPEWRLYVCFILISILIGSLGLWLETPHHPPGDALRRAAFTMVSVQTTTGFATDDFHQWPNYLRLWLLGMMVIGGCSGSTSGSFKVIRIIILFKVVVREIQKLVHPHAVIRIKVGKKPLNPDHVMNVVALSCLFLTFTLIGFFMLTMMGVDLTTALSASIATLFNIGPGLGQVGPAGHYGEIPFVGKWMLILWMVLGRLEIFGILLLFLPITWKK